MRRVFRVFISSTKQDLQEERNEAVQAILKLGHIPVGMEQFLAGRPSIEIIKEAIAQCDVYILIAGKRYGSIYDEGLSYTHFEYNYAKALDKPRFSIVYQSKDDCVIEEEQQDFIKIVCSEQCEFFSNISELNSALTSHLSRIIDVNKKNMNGLIYYSEITYYAGLKDFVFEYDARIYAKIKNIMPRLFEGIENSSAGILNYDICKVYLEKLESEELLPNICGEKVFVQAVLANPFRMITDKIKTIAEAQKGAKKCGRRDEYGLHKLEYPSDDNRKCINSLACELLKLIEEIDSAFRELSYDNALLTTKED